MVRLSTIAIAALAFQAPVCTAFIPQQARNPLEIRTIHSDGAGKLLMSNQFDVTKQVFDPLSLRSVRGDALVRYDATNQSQPLRIVLYAVSALTLLSAPFLVEAIGYDSMSTPATIATVALSIGSGGLFVQECTKRANKLTRIEKELNTESLPIRLPTNPFSDSPFSKAVTLKVVQNLKSPPRIIALCGNKSKLSEALSSLAIYRNRLSQASVYVVAVPTDGSTSKDWQVLDSSVYKTWLADSYQPQAWLDYFRGLVDDETSTNFDFRWFGLTSGGRSFGSGDGDIRIIQLMGQWVDTFLIDGFDIEYILIWFCVLTDVTALFNVDVANKRFLRPIDFLDASDKDAETTALEEEVLGQVKTFYRALTTGDKEGIDAVFSSSNSKEVSEVIDLGGRIDSWNDCLAEGARPSEMQVSGADVTIVSDTEAYTTCIEFPANTGMDSASLLAVQRFIRDDKNEPWKLDLHQTIPWNLEAKAQGTLQCDCRGCVALTRRKERRYLVQSLVENR